MIARAAAAGVGLGVLISVTGAGEAAAATYYWNNTEIALSTLYIEYCDGTRLRLYEDEYTSRNICKFWLPYNSGIFVYVKETGTHLFDTAYCGEANGKWVSFNSRNDTSRTARVSRFRANCA